jgi:hypothetical protein
MRTYAHFLMTAALVRPLKRRGFSVHTTAFLLGSVLPDLPFAILTLAYGLHYRQDQDLPWESIHILLHEIHFFTDPVWLAAHNFFHAPFILLAIGLIGYWLRHHYWEWGNRLLWFAAGAGLHTAVDIFTHHDDGPLILFPFEWTYRFQSPVSYWDPNHYGDIVGPLETVFSVFIFVYLLAQWWQARRKRRVVRRELEPQHEER